MQANWSLVLNVLLLIGVVIAISRMVKARRQNANITNTQPSIGVAETPPAKYDDIIAVRKVTREPTIEQPIIATISAVEKEVQPSVNPPLKTKQVEDKPTRAAAVPSVMMFLLAKENRQLAGYELLQTILTSGLRFGEGQLFHRHQSANGQGPVLCSLAAATETGTFDLQNMGAFSVHGLCLFMQASGNFAIDKERFEIMHDTAKQLSEGLDAHLLDDLRQPLSEAGIKRYYRLLGLGDPALEQTPGV